VEGTSPPPVKRDRIGGAMSLRAAQDVAGRLDYRAPGPCAMHCDGVGSAVRLRLEDERDYRFVLLSKKVGLRDEFQVSTTNRDTNLLFIENTDIGATLALRGEDALKVCARSETARGCEWTCTFDRENGVVKMTTNELSAEFAVFCY
jgi:hypothetical protein